MATTRVLPHNEDVEASVLGAVLIDKDAVSVISEIISPKDFYNNINGFIFSAMLSLYEQSKPIDLVTLTNQLKKNKTLEKVDSAYLAGLIETVPTAANAEHYARIIKEASSKRALIKIGGE
ncbi:MAG: replicative DNA helicase, partial [Candidatus Levybacteria bacterium CG22_combo_CG10-13_8_21_14_all_35_11]